MASFEDGDDNDMPNIDGVDLDGGGGDDMGGMDFGGGGMDFGGGGGGGGYDDYDDDDDYDEDEDDDYDDDAGTELEPLDVKRDGTLLKVVDAKGTGWVKPKDLAKVCSPLRAP